MNEEQDNNEIVEKELIDTSLKLMERPFNPALIKIENKLLTIDLLIKRISQSEPEIELNTESYFQRKDDLWDVVKQSRLIESILIRFPLPAFYFDGSNKNKWLVVDGLQRLSSLRNFAVKKTLKLTNLEFLTQLNGLGYDELNRDLQRTIEETQIVAYIINPGTPEDVKYNIFKRINTGGLILEPQEIRHALNQGEPSKFIAELADLEEFKITTISIRKERMLDRDFANRFLCFYLFGYENYVPDLDTFMSKAMAQISKMSDVEKQKCKQDFINSMNLNHSIFGEHAFRKRMKQNERRKPLNKALFDVFSVSFAKLSDFERTQLKSKGKQVTKEFKELLNTDEVFFAAISSSTGDRNRVFYRFNKIKEIIDKILKEQV